MFDFKAVATAFATWLALACATTAFASEERTEDWNAHFQTTYIWQKKPSFRAPYTGEFSLRPESEKSYTLSATAAFGFRPWKGGELYFNPEMIQGAPLSDLHGLGGMTNGELQKSAGPNPTFYRAKLFLRQTWELGGERESVASDMNQLAGSVDKRRLVLTAGNLAVIDIFDNNAYAHDARTQFLNWALIAHGAFDYAADARGYTWGAAVEYFYDEWTFRLGRFMQPVESNGLPLDTRLFTHYGDQIEFERTHQLRGQPGALRLLIFRNVANMGGFEDAVADGTKNGVTPQLARVRKERQKLGFGFNAEQSVTSDVGVFLRASANDGKSETYAFTEIERSVAVGAAIKGTGWGRAGDTIGIANVRNGLSKAHRAYLAAGGVGEFIGDGRLSYGLENIIEAYYSLKATRSTAITFDIQHIRNPAYNRDRGPVTVGSVRLHASF